jgi:hypothetical protein
MINHYNLFFGKLTTPNTDLFSSTLFTCQPRYYLTLSRSSSLYFSKRFYPGGKEIINATKALIPKPTTSDAITRTFVVNTRHGYSDHALMRARAPLLCTGPRLTTRLTVPTILPNQQVGHGIKLMSDHIETKNMDSVLGELVKIVNKESSPASISENTVITLINVNKKEYSTTINQHSTSDQFTPETMVVELKKREMIKDDDGKTAVTVLDKDNQPILVGDSKTKLKLSQVGQAYYEHFVKAKQVIHEQTMPLPQIQELSKARVGICIPPTTTSKTLVDIGMHKHMLLADDPQDKEYVIAYGFFTSKKSGEGLADKQFKAFQDDVEKKSPPSLSNNHEKKQQFVLYDPLRRIKADEIKFLKHDKEYLGTIPKEKWEQIYEEIQISWNHGIQEFPKEGITVEDALLMCKEYDKIAAQPKGKHPITADQAKINEDNKKMQHEKNQAKKQQSNKIHDDEKPNDKHD